MKFKLLFWYIFVLRVAGQSDLKTVSIDKGPDYVVARNCEKSCLFDSSGYWVGGQIGCVAPWYDKCYCNTDIASSAASYLSGCALTLCSGNQFATSAVSLYTDYCSQAGYPYVAANIAVQTSTQGVNTGSGAVTKTSLTVVTATTGTTTSNTAGELASRSACAAYNVALLWSLVLVFGY
jgi:hypothetical protein